MASKKESEPTPKEDDVKAQQDAQQQAPAEEAPAPQQAEQSSTPPQPAGEAAPERAPELEEPAQEAPAQEEPVAAEPVAQPAAQETGEPEAAESNEGSEGDEEERAEEAGDAQPRAKPAVPGAHLEVDIVPEGVDPLGRGEQAYEDPYALEEEYLSPAEAEVQEEEEQEEILSQPIATAAIDLAADARYRATGKRKTAIARVTLRPGGGAYLINGRTLEEHFPRATLQRNIRQPLEMVGYQERMDVVARLHGGGISAQAGALRHGVSRALLEADPNLRGELKRRGFLTRDSRAKERKKAGLKKARKRPQFSKR
jgi:small subunit ribosomal protein S9